MSDKGQAAAELAYAALMEAGRPDLALGVSWFDEGDDGYLETHDDPDDLDPGDVELVDRAEALVREWWHR